MSEIGDHIRNLIRVLIQVEVKYELEFKYLKETGII